jgi:hypothetical protein
MINDLIILCFGGVALAGIFMMASYTRIVLAEWRACTAVRCDPLHYRPLIMAVGLLLMSLGLFGVSAIRAYDGIRNGDDLGGSSPFILLLSLALIWGAKTMFQWGATMDRHANAWRLYVVLAVAWTVSVTWLIFAPA